MTFVAIMFPLFWLFRNKNHVSIIKYLNTLLYDTFCMCSNASFYIIVLK